MKNSTCFPGPPHGLCTKLHRQDLPQRQGLHHFPAALVLGFVCGAELQIQLGVFQGLASDLPVDVVGLQVYRMSFYRIPKKSIKLWSINQIIPPLPPESAPN